MNIILRASSMFLAVAVLAASAHAQDAEEKKEEPVYGWQNSAVIGANLTQVSLSNWTQGGENSVAFMVFSKNAFNRIEEFYAWKTALRLVYGETQIGDGEFEKSDDEIFFESLYSRNIGWAVDPYAALQVRTQFAPGYKLVENESGIEERVQSSGFWDPGYVQESFGFTYSTGPVFSTRLGIAFKQTFSKNYGFARDPNLENDDATFRFQTGLESSTKVDYDFLPNMKFTSQLDLFSAFETMDVWDVHWISDITGKINNYFNMSLSVNVVHVIAETRRTQVKQTLALGFSYVLM